MSLHGSAAALAAAAGVALARFERAPTRLAYWQDDRTVFVFAVEAAP